MIASADITNPDCGSTAQFNASVISVESDFEAGVEPSIWGSITAGNVNSNCGTAPGSTQGLFFPSVSSATRTAETTDQDLTNCSEVYWCFILGDGTSATGCEALDAGEGIELEYSTDGGTSWNPLFTMDDATYSASGWTCVSEAIPPAAQTASTRFRFDQPSNSGSTSDAWAIDNFQLACEDNTLDYSWSPTTGLDDPNIRNPQLTAGSSPETYTVTVTDPANPGCVGTADIEITPVLPTVNVSASDLTPICGDPVTLEAQAGGALEADFEAGIDPAVFPSITGGAVNTECGLDATGGTAALVFNPGSTTDRIAETADADLSSCTDVNFCFILGNNVPTTACENLDAGDDVVLQYSTNGGATWNTFFTMDDATYGTTGWQCVTVALPAPAQTASTRLRFTQPSYNGTDAWAIDNFSTTCSTPGLTYAWTPTTNMTGSNTATPVVDPTTIPTTYQVTVTDPLNPACPSVAEIEIVPETFPSNAYVDVSQPQCGGTINLFATGGREAEDDFDGGRDVTIWPTISNGSARSDCIGTATGAGDALFFPNGISTTNRSVTSAPQDVSSCLDVNWCVYFSDGAGGCNAMDNTDEVHLEYSTNGGTTWSTLFVMDDATYGTAGWTCINEELPPGAISPATNFRFRHAVGAPSTSTLDHWAIDDFYIGCPDEGSLSYNWTPTANMTGSNTSTPTVTNVSAATTYTVEITHPVDPSCPSFADVTVNPRELPVNAYIDDASPICGETAQLVAVGAQPFFDDFNRGEEPALWTAITNGEAESDCGPLTGSGQSLFFPEDGVSSVTRRAETVDYDLTACQDVSWCIWLSDGSGPCDAMENNDEVHLEYSTDGGTTWNTLNVMDGATYTPLGWTCLEEQLPADAVTGSTRFRFDQKSSSSGTFDNWGLDDFAVGCADPGLTYSWSPSTGLSSTTVSSPVF